MFFENFGSLGIYDSAKFCVGEPLILLVLEDGSYMYCLFVNLYF